MTLAERLGDARPAQRGLPCRTAVILADLDADDAHALRAALDIPKGDPRRLSSHLIASMLRLEGYDIHYKSIETHRKHGCRCFKHGAGRVSDA
jgi:hypothetical protein